MAAKNDRLAVLIDADNAQASLIQELLAEVSRYGTAAIKRAYGDWTTPNLRGWKDVLIQYAIQPIQQFSYTNGKNSTDSSLIIDAMDLLHAGRLNGFCLVSSDSDFTRLATRIREAGLTVYGFGEKKTPQSFVGACDKFIFTEILKPHIQPAIIEEKEKEIDPLQLMIRDALVTTDMDNGWATMSYLGMILLKNNPSFDSRNFGFRKLSDLARGQKYLDVKDLKKGDGTTDIRVRIKPPANQKKVRAVAVK